MQIKVQTYGELQTLIDVADKSYNMILYKAISPTEVTYRYNFEKNAWEKPGTPVSKENLVVIADFKMRRIFKDLRKRKLVSFCMMNGQNMSKLRSEGVGRFVSIFILDTNTKRYEPKKDNAQMPKKKKRIPFFKKKEVKKDET